MILTANQIYQPITVSGNWTIDFELYLNGNYTNYNGGANYYGMGIWVGTGTKPNVTGGGYGVYFGVNPQNSACPGGFKVYISFGESKNGTPIYTGSNGSTQFATQTKWYFRVTKTSNTGYTVAIYSDSGRTSLVESVNYTSSESHPYSDFTYMGIGGAQPTYNDTVFNIGNITCSQFTVTGGGTLNETFPYTNFTNYFHQMDNTKKMASLTFILNKADTAESYTTITAIRNASSATTKTPLSAGVRYLAMSDFTSGTQRYIQTNWITSIDVLYTKTPIYDKWGYKHSATLADLHYHSRLSGTSTESGIDS